MTYNHDVQVIILEKKIPVSNTYHVNRIEQLCFILW